MALVSLRCASCGADIELDEKREFGFCSYCGTKVMMDKKIVELKGKVNVDGISTADKLLERAFILIEDRDYFEADGYLNRVLELDPKCAKAYWGKMMCEFKIPYAKTAEIRGIDITQSNNYKRAVSYASGKQKEKYIEYGEKAAGTYGKNEQKEINKQKNNKTIFLVSKIVFAITPVIAYAMAMPTREGASKTVFSIFVIALSILWIVSYFTRKKLKSLLFPEKANKKSNVSIWCLIGGFLLVNAIFISFAERVPADDVQNNISTSSAVTTTEPTTEAPVEISVSKLIKAYEDNEINANNKYKDKKIKLSGYVDDISQSEGIFSESYYIYLDSGEKNSYDRILCSLSEKSVEKAAKLKKGDKIIIEGRCNGFSGLSISVSNCEIVD